MAATTRPDPRPGSAAAGSPVVITPMRRRHLRQVLRIDHQVYPRPWSLGLYLGELSTTDGRSYVVARQGTEVVGYAGLMVLAGDAHVTTVAVAPAHQRQGLATRLMLVVVRDALAFGAERVTLEVRASNRGAQSLYSRFGFAPAGVRRAYYVDNREDAVIMWAIDVGSPEYAERLARIEAALPTPSVLQGVRSGDGARVEGAGGRA
ncbi:ribosomal protein S18-alanine N-acetyltransferase [Iamia sp. SCSIO 61187]|uniref:ribosomal protein S18-alanine N-acetyltransferase n=1 Tax=Iamia sp. SCSIO 61187 TaxID=2722752 RepID=UPI001C63B74F|nr:ribosomal protein S18-alanine N-acetyltransferase [Iamia sp. SCSIO 61187]QYG94770.1 ribosomal protein S18-alanine N-acetyltransferase [Iamia sp. SCSIO 61187]